MTEDVGVPPNLPWQGGCRCGQVRFEISTSPLLAMACHCTGCQRMTASAFSTTLAVPEGGFAVIAGEGVIGGLHGDQSLHHHCGWCKSWLFTRFEPTMGFINVRATMLDNARWFVPFVETFTNEALPWAKTPARHSYPTFPPMETYGELIEEYAASRIY